MVKTLMVKTTIGHHRDVAWFVVRTEIHVGLAIIHTHNRRLFKRTHILKAIGDESVLVLFDQALATFGTNPGVTVS